MKKTTTKIMAIPNASGPTRPVIFNPAICNGCNQCIEVCPRDVTLPNPVKKRPPVIFFPDECWYCGACVFACKRSGAIKMNFPLMWRVPWKRKSTGEYHWVGKRTKSTPMKKKPTKTKRQS